VPTGWQAGRNLSLLDFVGSSIQSTGIYAKISDVRRERVAAHIELAREVAKI